MDFSKTTRDDITYSVPAKMPGWAKKFLEAYATNGEIRVACKYANISRQTHYKNLRDNPIYREAVEQVEDQIGGLLEDLAVERVRDGQLVLYQGEPVEVDGKFLREYDTQLHCTLLKRFRPNHYRDRASIDIAGELAISDALNEARARVITLEQNDRTGTEG